ncbi:MAG: hypothetical protein ACP5I4_13665 [Oceanipulchritudo sp.]
MRSSAIARIDYAEIDFKQGGILTPAEKTKKKRRQWIEDLPENLWAWLKKTPPQAFEMTHRQMLHRRAQAFKRAGLLVEASSPGRCCKGPQACSDLGLRAGQARPRARRASWINPC